jgi:hypothetical protein
MLTRGLKQHQHLALISAGRPIVILADMEKEDMEEELRNHNIDFLGSHVVCRSGPPLHACLPMTAMNVARTTCFVDARR